MVTPIAEFVDTYSDDMIFLQTVRRSLLRHPLETHMPTFLDATLSRLYIVMLVGNVENALNEESKRTEDPLLDVYLNARGANDVKVKALRDYLQQRLGSGVVEADVLADYLAIKYLRNGIIHADRRQGSQAQYIIDRGFPVDSRSLKFVHLQRLAEVDEAIITYLGMSQVSGVVGGVAGSVGAMVSPRSRIATDTDVIRPLTDGDFLKIHRRNLDFVGQSWDRLKNDRTDDSSDEQLLAFIRGLRSADDDSLTVTVGSWARSALYSWGELVRLSPEAEARRLVNEEAYRAHLLEISRVVVASNAYPRERLPAQIYRGLLELVTQGGENDDDQLASLFGGASDLDVHELLEFYAVGEVAYNLMAQIPHTWVWPIVMSGETEPALVFADLLELSRRWYWAIERHSAYDAAALNNFRNLIHSAAG